MKRLILPLLVAFVSFAFLGCSTSEFKVDGEFTAFEVSDAGNKPQVTSVTVTIEEGKIADYFIDVRQGYRTATVNDQGTEDTTDDVTTYAFGWNSQTKKELGINYKMHYYTYVGSLEDPNSATMEDYISWLVVNNKFDWFQQAELLEEYWLENGVDATELDEEGNFLNVAGVTVANSSYVELALEAVELAGLGKFQTILSTGTNLYFTSMIVSPQGEITDLILDVHQSTKRTAEGTFVWNEFTKQQLGYDYKMHYNAYLATLTNEWEASIEGYQTWLLGNNRLEWFEQAQIISEYVMNNGWDSNLQSIAGKGVSLDGVNSIDGTAGVTISTSTIFILLDLLFASVSDGQIN